MDVDNAATIQAANAAPVLVDPQVSNKDEPDISKARKAPESDSVEISSEAISANAVQNSPDVSDDASSQEGGPGLDQSVKQESSPVESENSVKQNDEAKTAPQTGLSIKELESVGNADGVSEDLENLRAATQESFEARRTTKYTVQDGKVSVKVLSGDKEIEIPPEEVLNTKSNLRQRLKAFVDASNIDINA